MSTVTKLVRGTRARCQWRCVSVSIPPPTSPRAVADAAALCQAIIWMHGLGDQGESWRSLQADFKAIGVPVKWQFPDAPVAAVTCNDGYKMRSWFDIEEIPVAQGARDYADDISASMERIHAMIATLEEEGYGAREIVVGGFSQGGALSIHAALRYPKQLGGAVCLSGWLMMQGSLEAWAHPNSRGTPIFWGHGESDNVVQYGLQAVGVSALRESQIGVVTDRTYRGMQHSTCDQELRDLEEFLQGLIR